MTGVLRSLAYVAVIVFCVVGTFVLLRIDERLDKTPAVRIEADPELSERLLDSIDRLAAKLRFVRRVRGWK